MQRSSLVALARHGDLTGAMAQLKNASQRGPHWADPLKTWGDVLVKQGHTRETLVKYDQALKYAPNWAAVKDARAAAVKQRVAGLSVPIDESAGVGIVNKRGLVALAAMSVAALGSARAEVTGVEVLERSAFASGVRFGDAGAYEKIRGIARFSLDPYAAANQRIVDLELAARDASGRVTFESPFILLRPVKARSSTLLYDVNNRGGIAILGQLDGASPANNDPTTVADAGDGFLMHHGFTLLFSAWTWDVAPQAPGVKPLVFVPPVAHKPDGTAITGLVENEFIVNAPRDITTYAGMRGLTYEPATPNDPAATLTARSRPSDTRVAVDRAHWHFVAPEQPGGPGRVQLDGGFQPGMLYELIYTAKDPYVTGAGLAGIRDLLAYFRDHSFAGAPAPRKVLIFGISQSGRVIGRMLHDGLNVDETGRLALRDSAGPASRSAIDVKKRAPNASSYCARPPPGA